MHSIEIPSPPKFLLIVVAFIAIISFSGLKIGELYYAKVANGKSPKTTNITKYTLLIHVKQQKESAIVLKQVKKYGAAASIETKNVFDKIKTGCAVMEYFPESLGKIAADALRTHNYHITVEPTGKDKVSVRVEGIYSDKGKCESLLEELKSKGYIFKIHTYEQTVKKQFLTVVLKNLNSSLSERIAKEMTASGYLIEKLENK